MKGGEGGKDGDMVAGLGGKGGGAGKMDSGGGTPREGRSSIGGEWDMGR